MQIHRRGFLAGLVGLPAASVAATLLPRATPQALTPEEFAPCSGPVVNIHVNGSVFDNEQTAEWLVEQIRQQVEQNDCAFYRHGARLNLYGNRR